MKKKTEASKKIIIVCYVILTAVLAATYAALFMYREISGLEQIVIAVTGLVATANGFYFWKARAENTIRMSKAYDVEIEKAKKAAQDADMEIEYFNTGGENEHNYN